MEAVFSMEECYSALLDSSQRQWPSGWTVITQKTQQERLNNTGCFLCVVHAEGL
jgi:hypothetical protein